MVQVEAGLSGNHADTGVHAEVKILTLTILFAYMETLYSDENNSLIVLIYFLWSQLAYWQQLLCYTTPE